MPSTWIISLPIWKIQHYSIHHSTKIYQWLLITSVPLSSLLLIIVLLLFVDLCTLRHHAPWFTDEIRTAKAMRRRLERQWRADKTKANHQLYTDHCRVVNELIRNAKEVYYSSIIDNSHGNQQMFQISVKSGVSTALYDKSIKLGTLILDIMGNIFKIRGNRHMLRDSQERVVKVLGVIIQNGRRQRCLFGVETYSIIV